jgi:hypothetical protein
MNIILIYPEFPDTFWSYKHALKFIGKRALLPPLGLLTIAAMLLPEWSVRLARTWYRFVIVNRGRIYYWKLLVWTRFRRPRLFPVAITLAICGYQYR